MHANCHPEKIDRFQRRDKMEADCGRKNRHLEPSPEQPGESRMSEGSAVFPTTATVLFSDLRPQLICFHIESVEAGKRKVVDVVNAG
jgi:hypothetical protein